MHARYDSPYLSRFLRPDPAASAKPADPQSWNRYAYVGNNPLKAVDPDGKEAFIILVSAADKRVNWKGSLGHAALYVIHGSESRGVSYTGEHQFESDMQSLVSKYLKDKREVRVFLLETTREQDQAMLEFLQANPNGGIDRDASVATNNCTRAVCNVLDAGGIIGVDEGHVFGARMPALLGGALESGKIKTRSEILYELEEAEAQDDEESDFQ